jgi:hypothetical protein
MLLEEYQAAAQCPTFSCDLYAILLVRVRQPPPRAPAQHLLRRPARRVSRSRIFADADDAVVGNNACTELSDASPSPNASRKAKEELILFVKSSRPCLAHAEVRQERARPQRDGPRGFAAHGSFRAAPLALSWQYPRAHLGVSLTPGLVPMRGPGRGPAQRAAPNGILQCRLWGSCVGVRAWPWRRTRTRATRAGILIPPFLSPTLMPHRAIKPAVASPRSSSTSPTPLRHILRHRGPRRRAICVEGAHGGQGGFWKSCSKRARRA